MEFTTLIWLLPIVFMIHDFEEIIMMQAWQSKNKEYLETRFPRLGKRITGVYQNLSTASFSLAVLEEFLILAIAAWLAVQLGNFLLWTAGFFAFFLHLFIHVAQWAIIRRYIPAIITSFLSLPYCFYTFNILISKSIYTNFQLLLILVFGTVFLAVNLVFIHKMAARFEKWLIKYASKNDGNTSRK